MKNYKVIRQIKKFKEIMESEHVAFAGNTLFRFKPKSLKLILVSEWTTMQILLQTKIAIKYLPCQQTKLIKTIWNSFTPLKSVYYYVSLLILKICLR